MFWNCQVLFSITYVLYSFTQNDQIWKLSQKFIWIYSVTVPFLASNSEISKEYIPFWTKTFIPTVNGWRKVKFGLENCKFYWILCGLLSYLIGNCLLCYFIMTTLTSSLSLYIPTMSFNFISSKKWPA